MRRAGDPPAIMLRRFGTVTARLAAGKALIRGRDTVLGTRTARVFLRGDLIHVPQNAPSPTMSLTSELRTQLVQTIAMVELSRPEVSRTMGQNHRCGARLHPHRRMK
jgi:hypothetical protein